GVPSLPAQTAEDRPAFFVPTRPPTRQELDRRESLKRYALGLLCEREDRLLEAIRAFEYAARLDPEAAPVFKALIPLYLAVDRGVMYESAQEYEPAAAAFAEAAKILEHPDALLELGPLGPQDLALRGADLYERIGRAYLQVRKHDQALAAFRKAQARYPDGAGRLNYNLARICQEQGKPGEALGYLDAYLRLQPQGTDAYDLKITLLQRL